MSSTIPALPVHTAPSAPTKVAPKPPAAAPPVKAADTKAPNKKAADTPPRPAEHRAASALSPADVGSVDSCSASPRPRSWSIFC